MSEPVPPPVPLPGGVVLGPDGSVSFPGQAQQGQAGGPTPIVPGVQEPAPSPAPPPVVGSGQFTVDLERAPQALKALREARTKLEQLQQDSLLLGNVVPPAADSVSRDAALALRAVAVSGPASFHGSLGAGLRQLRSLVQRLEEDLRVYEETEDEAQSVLEDRP